MVVALRRAAHNASMVRGYWTSWRDRLSKAVCGKHNSNKSVGKCIPAPCLSQICAYVIRTCMKHLLTSAATSCIGPDSRRSECSFRGQRIRVLERMKVQRDGFYFVGSDGDLGNEFANMAQVTRTTLHEVEKKLPMRTTQNCDISPSLGMATSI